LPQQRRAAPASAALKAASTPPAAAQQLPDAAALLAALGGRANLTPVEGAASRLRLPVRDAARGGWGPPQGTGRRGVAVAKPGCVHVIVGPGAAAAGAQLKRLLA